MSGLPHDAIVRQQGAFKQGTSNLDNEHYNETIEYDKMGNITKLSRSVFGSDIDNLTLTYNGNQLKNVIDEEGNRDQYNIKEYHSEDPIDLNINTTEFMYDANGNLNSDVDRGIVTIKYNLLNLPNLVQFKNGSQIVNKYDANGVKLSSEYYNCINHTLDPLEKDQVYDWTATPWFMEKNSTLYVGNIEYKTENADWTTPILSRISNSEGYVDNLNVSMQSIRYNYYRQDHLGNNREVWHAAYNQWHRNENPELGYYEVIVPSSTIQRTEYYPSGLPLAESIGASKQPYKYNGKEFIEMHGYDTYDYGARGMYAAIMRWTSVDPLAESYYSISPYAYCAGNPVGYVDVEGQWIKDAKGEKITITYNANGSLSFSKNADANTKRIAKAMNLTESGRSMLKFADNSSIGVRMILSSATKTRTDSNKKTHTTNGETLQGNKNESDNFGKVVNEDGTFGIKEATITVYEGSLKKQIKKDSKSKLEGLSLEQAIGAVAGHEITHATNKGEINKDLKAENSGVKRTDQEVKPNNVEKKIIDESKKTK